MNKGFAVSLALCLKVSLELEAATLLWNGGGGNDDWSTALNWNGVAFTAGDTLQFGGSTRLTPVNNLAADTLVGGMVFLNDTNPNPSVFTLTGNRITLGGDISTTAAAGVAFNATLTSVVSLDLLLNGNRTITTNNNSDKTHNLAINGSISDGGGGFGLIKSGGSQLRLGGGNTYSGVTSVTDGVLVLGHATALPGGTGTTGGTSGLTLAGTVNNGAVIGLGAGDFTRGLGTGADQVQWTGHGGFAAFGADRIVNLGGAGATVQWAAGNFVPNNFNLIFGYGNGGDSQDSTHTVDFQNPIDLNGGVRSIRVNDGNNGGPLGTARIDAVLSGGLINSTGTGSFSKDGAGVLSLTDASTYTGQTRVNDGVLLLSHADALPGGTGLTGGTSNLRISGNTALIGLTAASGNFTRDLGTGVNQVQWTSGGGFAAFGVDRFVNIGGAGAQMVWATGGFVVNGGLLTLGHASADAVVDFQNPIDLGATTRTISANGNTGSAFFGATVSGVLSGTGGLIKTGDGNLTLAAMNNTFTGQLDIQSNVLRVTKLADFGQDSSIGHGTSGVPILMSTQFRTAVLDYSGAGDSSNRTVHIGTTNAAHTSGAVLRANGTGPIVFTAANFNDAIAGVTVARTFSLGGTNTGLNTISGVIQNTNGASGVLNLVKENAGTWVLSGANTYSGTTTLTSGTLHLNNSGSGGTSSAIGTGAFTISTGTTIDNSSGAPVTLSTANTVNINGSFTFGGSNDLSFVNGTVTYAGSRTVTMNGTGRTLSFGAASPTNANTFTVNDAGTGNKLTFTSLVLAENNLTRTQTFSGSGAIEITGSVTDGPGSGADNLSYTGSGLMTLGGTNSYTGVTTLSNATGTLTLKGANTTSAVNLTTGTLNINHANAIGSGALSISAGTIDNTSGSALTIATPNSVAWNGNFSFGGTNDLSFANGTASAGGGRTITLNGTNKTLTFGAVTFNNTLTTTVNDAGTGNKLVLGGVVIADANQPRTHTFAGSAAIDITGAVVDGPGTGADGLTYTGSSVLQLMAASSYTGITTVNTPTGTLRTTSTGSIGTGAAAVVRGTLELNNTAQTVGTLGFGSGTTSAQTTAATVLLSAGTTLTLTGTLTANDNINAQASFLTGGTIDLKGARTWTVENTADVDDDLTVTTSIINTVAGTFTKNGTGRLVLNSGNSFADVFAIADGIVRIAHANALGTAAGGTTVNTGDVLEISGGITVIGEGLLLNGTGIANTGGLRNVSGNNVWTGTIDLAGDARIQAESGTQLTVSAITAGGTSRDITFGGDGDHIASGRIGSGGTNPVDQIFKDGAGTLTLMNPSNDFTSTVSINNGIVKLGASEVIPNVENVTINKGVLQLNGQTETITSLTLGATTTTVAGNTASILDTPTGGILRLGGNSTYNAGSIGFENGQATISANLDVNNASRTFTVNDNATLTEELVISGVISNSGAAIAGFTKAGTGTLVISGANNYNGTTTINAGTVKLGADNTLPDTPLTLDQRLGGISALDLAGHNDAITNLTLSGNSTTVVNSASQIIDSVGGGILKLGGSVTYNTGAASFHNSTSTLSASLDLNGGNRTFTINDSTNAAIDVLISGAVINTGATAGLTKAGAGTLTLTGANTYDGVTTVSAGSLQVGNSGNGQTGTGAVTIANTATLFGTGNVRGSSFTASSGSTIHAGDSTSAGTTGSLAFTSVSGSGSFNFQSGSSTVLDIILGGTSDRLTFTGTGGQTLLFNGNLTVGPTTLNPTMAEVFALLDWTGLASSPTFAGRYTYLSLLYGNGDEATGLDLPDIFGSGFAWDISSFTTSGSIAIVAVPEPGRACLILGSLILLAGRRRRVSQCHPRFNLRPAE